MLFSENIYIEGGPWESGFNGRGDFRLLRPVDEITLYPGDGKEHCYCRTDCTWKSPLYGTIHTIFRYADMIDRFNGEYVFLSNFYSSPIIVDRIKYPTVEHAFQAAKTLNWQEKQLIAYARAPGQAKRMGCKLSLRSDWEEIKIDVMLELVRLKFADSNLRTKFLATGDAELIERNTWGDKFWGVCQGEGQNQLGKILMKVREECRVQLKYGN